ncbi:ECH1 protein, partial [Bucco capensis]|nr:ECH1 protein [Bucco capensis]
QDHIVHLELSRAQQRNAMDTAFWGEMVKVFKELSDDSEVRAVIISGDGSCFSAGIDLHSLGSEILGQENPDPARRAWSLRKKIQELQESFSIMEKCPKPVIAAVHGACIGAGVDLICACDIRYCSQDAWFQVKEVDMGLAADVGTLQRLPKIVGSQSLVNELSFTARKLLAPEALSCGLVSRVLPDKEALLAAAQDVAVAIAAKSPLAVQGTKVNLLYARDHPVPEALGYVATWNMAMLQSQDLLQSVHGAMQKKLPKDIPFANL